MLPATPSPHAGESFTSLVRRTLRANNLTREDMCTRFPAINWKSRQNLMTSHELRTATRAMGIPIELARPTTMARYVTAFPTIQEVLDGHRAVNSHARRNWYWVSTTQACIPCLDRAPGTWQLAWHLPWSIICDEHTTPLHATCPICEEVLFEAHRCPGRVGGPRRPEDVAPIAMRLFPDLQHRGVAPRVRHTAAAVNAALDGNAVSTEALGELTCSEYLDAVRSLAGLQEHFADYEPGRGVVTRRAVAAPPRDTSARTSLLVTAHTLLHGPPEGVVQHVRQGLDALQLGSSTRLTWLRDRTIAIPSLRPLLEEAAKATASVGHRRWSGPRTVRDTGRIPQLIWPEVWSEVTGLTESGEVTGRAFASLTMAKAILSSTWKEAGTSLGLAEAITTRLARSGHQALLAPDDRYFEALQTLIGTTGDAPDYRLREQVTRARLLNDQWMAEARAVLGVSAAFDAVIRHHAWHGFVHGHPSTTPVNGDFDHGQRARLAVQRRRWEPTTTQALFNLLASEVVVQ